MKWTVEYSKQADDFIEEQGIQDKVRGSIKDFILKISGSNINIDSKKLKGEWAGYYRIRKGNIRVIIRIEIESRSIYVDTIDFRGSAYR